MFIYLILLVSWFLQLVTCDDFFRRNQAAARKEGLCIVEGDIGCHSKYQMPDHLKSKLSGRARNVDQILAGIPERWKDPIHYIIDDDVPSNMVNAIGRALNHILTSLMCFNFQRGKPRGRGYIRFSNYPNNSDLCYTNYIGYFGPQPHTIYLGKNCDLTWYVTHEIMHVLGAIHEHSRPDRDKYIYINYDNIDPRNHHNFHIQDPQLINYKDYEFDDKSIMLYAVHMAAINEMFPSMFPVTNKLDPTLFGWRTFGRRYDDSKAMNNQSHYLMTKTDVAKLSAIACGKSGWT